MTAQKRRKGSMPETPMFKFPTPDFKAGETKDAWLERAKADFARKVEGYVADVHAWQASMAAPKASAAPAGGFQGGGGTSGGGGATGGW